MIYFFIILYFIFLSFIILQLKLQTYERFEKIKYLDLILFLGFNLYIFLIFTLRNKFEFHKLKLFYSIFRFVFFWVYCFYFSNNFFRPYRFYKTKLLYIIKNNKSLSLHD